MRIFSNPFSTNLCVLSVIACIMAYLKRVQRPAAFVIVCVCFCEFRTVSYSGSCGEQVVDLAQNMVVFVLPLSGPLGVVGALRGFVEIVT